MHFRVSKGRETSGLRSPWFYVHLHDDGPFRTISDRRVQSEALQQNVQLNRPLRSVT